MKPTPKIAVLVVLALLGACKARTDGSQVKDNLLVDTTDPKNIKSFLIFKQDDGLINIGICKGSTFNGANNRETCPTDPDIYAPYTLDRYKLLVRTELGARSPEGYAKVQADKDALDEDVRSLQQIIDLAKQENGAALDPEIQKAFDVRLAELRKNAETAAEVLDVEMAKQAELAAVMDALDSPKVEMVVKVAEDKSLAVTRQFNAAYKPFQDQKLEDDQWQRYLTALKIQIVPKPVSFAASHTVCGAGQWIASHNIVKTFVKYKLRTDQDRAQLIPKGVKELWVEPLAPVKATPAFASTEAFYARQKEDIRELPLFNASSDSLRDHDGWGTSGVDVYNLETGELVSRDLLDGRAATLCVNRSVYLEFRELTSKYWKEVIAMGMSQTMTEAMANGWFCRAKGKIVNPNSGLPVGSTYTKVRLAKDAKGNGEGVAALAVAECTTQLGNFNGPTFQEACAVDKTKVPNSDEVRQACRNLNGDFSTVK